MYFFSTLVQSGKHSMTTPLTTVVRYFDKQISHPGHSLVSVLHNWGCRLDSGKVLPWTTASAEPWWSAPSVCSYRLSGSSSPSLSAPAQNSRTYFLVQFQKMSSFFYSFFLDSGSKRYRHSPVCGEGVWRVHAWPTRLPVPLPTGGCASAACRMVHTISSISALSCLSDSTAETDRREWDRWQETERQTDIKSRWKEQRQEWLKRDTERLSREEILLRQLLWLVLVCGFKGSTRSVRLFRRQSSPSSPWTGSSSRSSVIHSQSLSSSWELSHSESTR